MVSSLKEERKEGRSKEMISKIQEWNNSDQFQKWSPGEKEREERVENSCVPLVRRIEEEKRDWRRFEW